MKIGEAAEQKIEQSAEEQPKKKWLSSVLGNIALGGAGASLGYGAGVGAEYLLKKKFPDAMTPTPGKVKVVKNVVLPILGGASVILGNRYRNLMDKSHSQAPGWPSEKK